MLKDYVEDHGNLELCKDRQSAETTLALHIIPNLLLRRKKSFIFKLLPSLKILIKFIINIFFNKELQFKANKIENSLLFISFTEYMRRDVLDPLDKYIKNDPSKFNINYTDFNSYHKINFKYLIYLFKGNGIKNLKKYHMRILIFQVLTKL